jgi:hypothetical protein
MDPSLTLRLELVAHEPAALRFRLTVLSQSRVRLMLPLPTDLDLRFGNVGTGRAAAWGHDRLVLYQTARCGWVLPPGGREEFEWRVRPCGVAPPPNDLGDCVKLPAGEYLAWFVWKVDDGYFEPHSLMGIQDLEHFAAEQDATVWRGKAVSNAVGFTRSEPSSCTKTCTAAQ